MRLFGIDTGYKVKATLTCKLASNWDRIQLMPFLKEEIALYSLINRPHLCESRQAAAGSPVAQRRIRRKPPAQRAARGISSCRIRIQVLLCCSGLSEFISFHYYSHGKHHLLQIKEPGLCSTAGYSEQPAAVPGACCV